MIIGMMARGEECIVSLYPYMWRRVFFARAAGDMMTFEREVCAVVVEEGEAKGWAIDEV
jgi:hypothetical protein